MPQFTKMRFINRDTLDGQGIGQGNGQGTGQGNGQGTGQGNGKRIGIGADDKAVTVIQNLAAKQKISWVVSLCRSPLTFV